MNHSRIIIVGAGPAGLATAGRLRHAGIDDFILLEASNHVGNSWRNHYDRLHLHTVNQWSNLPHVPFPDEYPLYVSRQQFVDYLENYAAHFKIVPRLNHRVHLISKENDKWTLQTDKGVFQSDYVIIASGVNNIPNNPVWEGQELFNGEIVHSRNYKNPLPFKNKKVLVVGMGNTGAELTLDLTEHETSEVHLSVRSSVTLVPRDLNGRPIQVTAKQLAKIPFGIGDWLGSQIRKIYFGNLAPYGLEISKVHPTVQLRETGKTPVIDIGTIAAIKKGLIKVHPQIKSFKPEGVIFEDRTEIEVDSVILATGYLTGLEKLIPSIKTFFDKQDLPKSSIGEALFNNMYFVGFDNYKVGGLLGTIITDSKKIVDNLILKS